MKTSTLVLLAVLTACTGAAQAQTPPRGDGPPAGYGPGMMGGYGSGYGPGMMGGYGRGGMMGGYGPGDGQAYGPGYGPGMMGGYGRGGMMGGYGSGYGQGYGPGYGRGMMGGYGGGMMGYGMMGYGGPLHLLDLSEQQLAKINQIQDEMRRKNWGVMGKLQDERAHMRDLFSADKRDPGAIGKQAMKIADLRRQLLEAAVDAHNRIEALLTKEQKDQLRSYRRRGWMMGND